MEASSHFNVLVFKARPAGQRCRRGYPPTQSQYRTQLFSIGTAPFGVSLQIAMREIIEIIIKNYLKTSVLMSVCLSVCLFAG